MSSTLRAVGTVGWMRGRGGGRHPGEKIVFHKQGIFSHGGISSENFANLSANNGFYANFVGKFIVYRTIHPMQDFELRPSSRYYQGFTIDDKKYSQRNINLAIQ